MIHRLPNEILLKILEKTKSKTVKECRLLNSQFDNLIKQFQLHLLEIDKLSIKTYSDGDYALSLTLGESEDPPLINLKFNSYKETLSELTNQIKKIFNNVHSKFVYRGHFEDLIEIPCLDDSLLENYIDSGKCILVDLAFTSYTLGGVKEFLMELSKSGRSITWESGIMKNVTAAEMNKLLKKLKAEYEQHDEHPENIYLSFSVSKLGAKQNIYMRAVRNLTLN